MNALCTLVKTYGPLLGRILITVIFLRSAFGKITGFSVVAAGMAKKGMPFAEFLLVGAIAFEIVGSLMVLFGWKARWGALLLVLFTIPATLFYHDFWNMEAAQYRGQLNHFMKNLSIVGALIFVIGMGPGPLSLEKSREQPGS
ncbi:MAG: DoxX family protein [Betaproteobacteria bacterium]|nr:DoxX family protein [Betaproteobacteria bacterium]MDH3437813.1 DoxX family protein [Betaproteobacteria bacterium]